MWHRVTLNFNDDNGVRQEVNVQMLACVVSHHNLVVFAPKHNRFNRFNSHFYVITAQNDRHKINLEWAIEMVQTGDSSVFFLLATGDVFYCKIDYANQTYRSSLIHTKRNVRMSIANDAYQG